jgi:glycosyltransferase involved in cell wall biosynthesis
VRIAAVSKGLMRVLFLSTWFPYPIDNGSKIRVHYLLKALAERHQVSLMSFAFDTADPDRADELRTLGVEVQAIHVNPFEQQQMMGARQFLSLTPAVTHPVREMSDAVRAMIGRQSFDTVIASTEVTATYTQLLPRGVKRVLEEHNSMSRWMWERYRSQTSALQRLRCWVSWAKTSHYEAHLFRQFDLCTMVSRQDRLTSLGLVRNSHARIEVIPNGVDCQRNRPGLSPVVLNRLIYTGAMTYQVNYNAVEYFLDEVYPIVRQSTPEVNLTVTGSRVGVDLSRLKVDDSVHFSGYVDDVRPLVSSSSICVVPIQAGGGTRLKILEAMALGTPVISTSKGAEGLAVTHNEHLLIADDPITFAGAIQRLLNEPDLRQRLAANARRLVEQHYDWDQIGRRFVDLIDCIK